VTSVAIGLSTCPNDTFAFHALMAGEVDAEGLELSFELADVEELNRGLRAGNLDVCKASAHTALSLCDRVGALPCGWAVGHGVGPVVLARDAAGPGAPRRVAASRAAERRGAGSRRARPIVLCPGEGTTATLLWKLFHPEPVELRQCVFTEIMPALRAGRADLGVCIHEGRFTWREQGLTRVEDLGETWERATASALPLGGLVARTSLESGVVTRLVRAVRASLEWGLAHRDACLPTMRRHAQEHRDDVLWAHVDLYVNERTLDLGAAGRAGLAALSRLARERGLLPEGGALRVLPA